jgi:hypothetical protein
VDIGGRLLHLVCSDAVAGLVLLDSAYPEAGTGTEASADRTAADGRLHDVGRRPSRGSWVDQVVGLDGVRPDIAMLRPPYGHGRWS